MKMQSAYAEATADKLAIGNTFAFFDVASQFGKINMKPHVKYCGVNFDTFFLSIFYA